MDLEQMTYASNSIKTIGTLLATLVLSQVISILSDKLKHINPDDNGFEDLIPFMANLARGALYVLALYIILKIWGIDVTPLLASAGVAGVAIGFAAKDMVANLFGGISIFMDKPFKVGDYVLVEGTQRGRVHKVGARSTKILTLDNILVTIPNSLLVTSPIYNETGYNPEIKIRVDVGVAYDSDLDKVEEVLRKVLNEIPEVYDEPEPSVYFTAFNSSSIDLIVVATVKDPSQKVPVTHKLIKEITKRFRDENIVIPFAQMDVSLISGNKS